MSYQIRYQYELWCSQHPYWNQHQSSILIPSLIFNNKLSILKIRNWIKTTFHLLSENKILNKSFLVRCQNQYNNFDWNQIMHYAVPDDQSWNNTGIPQPYRKYRYYPYPEDIRYLLGAIKGITSLGRYYSWTDISITYAVTTNQ